ncbi:LRR receptor-like serine/threonine-protein kinase RPK2 [Camellia lanceoleosa]|nr:LRR receptor-like serine/threonine-protein kinase RPK2 [Camellia lanceoleosa]
METHGSSKTKSKRKREASSSKTSQNKSRSRRKSDDDDDDDSYDSETDSCGSPIDLHKFDAISKCESLNHLKLSNNYFVGAIPSVISKCSNLRTLLLDGNIFQGLIPLKLGQIHQLRILDVSRNSITDRIPIQLANCRKLSFVMLTNLANPQSDQNSSSAASGGCGVREFNAFDRGIPYEVLLLPNLQIFWVPKANLKGRLPDNWRSDNSNNTYY